MFDHQPKRHPCNTKLKLFYNNEYHGFAVQQQLAHGPLIENYLERGLETLQHCLSVQARTFVCRVDLRYPVGLIPRDAHISNEVMTRFFYHLNKELAWADTKYSTEIRYIWCRERNSSEAPHYHLMLLLNYDAIGGLGNYGPSTDGTYNRENLFHRIVRAWAWAIGRAAHDMSGLVHACQDKLSGQVYQRLERRFPDSLKSVVYAMSYLCKAYSKSQELGQGFAVFTTSRV